MRPVIQLREGDVTLPHDAIAAEELLELTQRPELRGRHIGAGNVDHVALSVLLLAVVDGHLVTIHSLSTFLLPDIRMPETSIGRNQLHHRALLGGLRATTN